MARNDNLPIRHRQDSWMEPRDVELWSPDTFFTASPWQMMRRMRDEMDRVFGDLMNAGGGTGSSMQVWNPSIDVSEDQNEYCIEVDLPGVKPDKVHVEVQRGQLSIHAEMREESLTPQLQGTDQNKSTGGQRQYHRRERRYGSFTRTFPLPDDVDQDQIRCDFRDGVLICHLPKSEQHRLEARRIPVGGAPSEIPAKESTEGKPATGQQEATRKKAA